VKAIIIYFSLTGNTQKVAYAIRKGISQQGELCDIARLKELDTKDLINYDLIGFGSPVWGGMPPAVKLFLGKMPSLPGKHSFTFSTHGAKPFCLFPLVVRLLVDKGLINIGVGEWFGSVCIPYLPKPYPTDLHPDETDLMQAENFGKEMVLISRRISEGETNLIPPLPEYLPPRLSSGPRPEQRYNKQKCRYPECRLCMDNCPLGIINLSVSPVIFPKKCQPCNFCEMICPEGAIEADYDSTLGKLPLSMKDEFEAILNEESQIGRFRRLIPKENVDWNTPFYKISKHPRIII
jgi:ferredoxin